MRVSSLLATALTAGVLTLAGAGIASADEQPDPFIKYGAPSPYENQFVNGGAQLGGGAAAMADSALYGSISNGLSRTADGALDVVHELGR
jgi:hypothetical protein